MEKKKAFRLIFFLLLLSILFFVLKGFQKRITLKERATGGTVKYSPKKGLGGPVPVSHFSELGISWFYSWSFIPGLKDPNNLGIGNAGNINWDSQLWEKFVPLFGTGGRDWVAPMSENYPTHMGYICSRTNYCQGNYYLVGNEPNLCGHDWAVDASTGSCLTSRVDSIARSVKTYGEIIKMIKSKDQNAKIILLGLASGDSNTVGSFDLNYFNEFVDQWKAYWLTKKNDPILKNLADAISGWHVHLYGLYTYCPTDDSFAQGIKQSINQKMQAVFGKTVPNQEIWITEMGSLVGIPTSGVEWGKFQNRMRCLVNVFENSNAVNRYAWFYHGCGTSGEGAASACYGGNENGAFVLYHSGASGYTQTDLKPIYALLPDTVSATNTPIPPTPTATTTPQPNITPTVTPTVTLTATSTPTSTPTPTLFTWRREAENGILTSPMVPADGTNVSACRFVFSGTENSGAVVFTVNIPSTKNYYLWARSKGVDWTHNSFSVSFDGGTAFAYEIGQFNGVWQWGWEKVKTDPNNPTTNVFSLTAGSHTLRFAGREPNAKLDEVLLTNRETYVPNYVQACGSNTPTPTPACNCLENAAAKAVGDANCNGSTDGVDYEIWRQEFWGIRTTKQANFNCGEDDVVNGIDFEIWRSNRN